MRRALPAIAVSAAGLTWLLHAQGVIDTATVAPAAGGRAAPADTAGSSGAAGATTSVPPTTTRRGNGFGRTPPTSTAPTTAAPGATGGTPTDGPVVDTRFGPVQVEAVIKDNQLVDVRFLQYPNAARVSVNINNRAMPTLVEEALTAQSAQVDTVSGATYTSDGYVQSLQAALDQAGFKH